MINNLSRTLVSGLNVNSSQSVDDHVTVSRATYRRPLFSSARRTHYFPVESTRDLSASIKLAKSTLKTWAKEGPETEVSARSSLVKQLFDKNINDKQKPRMERERILLPESITLHASSISALPDNMTVTGDLTLDDWKSLQAIPGGLSVKGDFNIIGSEELTNLTPMILGGDLVLRDCCEIENIPAWITDNLPTDIRRRYFGPPDTRTVAFIGTELSQQAHEQITAGQARRTNRGGAPLRYFIESGRDEVSRESASSLRSGPSMPLGRGRTTQEASHVNIEMLPHRFGADSLRDNLVNRSNTLRTLKQDINKAKSTLTNWANNAPRGEMDDRHTLIGQLFSSRVHSHQQPRLFNGEILIPNNIRLSAGSISELPSNMKIIGKLELIDCSKLESIPRGLSVTSELRIVNAPELKNFREMRELDGHVLLSGVSPMERIPELLLDLSPRVGVQGDRSFGFRMRSVHIEHTALSDEANNQIEEYIRHCQNNGIRPVRFSTDHIRARQQEQMRQQEADNNGYIQPRGDEPQYDALPLYPLTKAQVMDLNPRCVLTLEETKDLERPVILRGNFPAVVDYGALLRAYRSDNGCPSHSSGYASAMEIRFDDIFRVDKAFLSEK